MVESLTRLLVAGGPSGVAVALAVGVLVFLSATMPAQACDDQAVADLPGIHGDYDWRTLVETDLPPSPLDAVAGWLAQAVERGLPEPGAMVLSTATPGGEPSSRTVLLRAVSDGGLVFFSNRQSRKGRELAANPKCAALLRWDVIHRQISVTGRAEATSDSESDTYFAGRPRASRIGAWASSQSDVLADRAELEARVAEVEARFATDDVPRPPQWGGYRIIPETVELWQGRPNRLHDRLRYRRDASGRWIVERLAP